EIEGLDLRQFLVDRRTSGDDLDVVVLAGLLERVLGAVYARLDIELARRRDEQRYRAALDQAGDALPHEYARLIEILANIGQALVAAAGGRVGIVGKHRDAGRQGPLRRLVEGLRVDDRHADGVSPGCDRG